MSPTPEEIGIPKQNRHLAFLLDAAGWRPETLARRLNELLARRPGERLRITLKRPYGWLAGEVPRPPIPDLVVWLLAEATGEPVEFDQLWPPGTRRSLLWVPADQGLDVTWDQPGLHQLLDDWATSVLTRRRFTAISGAALTGFAWQWLDQPVPRISTVSRDGGTVSDAVVSVVEATVSRAQRLDDHQGGGVALDYVGDQASAVLRMLRRNSFDAAVGTRLYSALAQLSQTAGFMAYDSGDDGTAQRWYLLGLRAAHAAGNRPFAASIISLMSNQAAALGHSGDALQLAAAAQEAARDATPTVRALIAARAGLAHAAAGDLSGYLRTREETLAAHALAGSQPEPPWVYYVSGVELDAIAGRSVAALARRIPARQDRLLTDAEKLLKARASDDAPAYQRSAFRHGAWLALAYTQAGELGEAVTTGRRVLDRLPAVTSVRSVGVLRQLRHDLSPHARRNPTVGHFVADLDRQLPAASVTDGV